MRRPRRRTRRVTNPVRRVATRRLRRRGRRNPHAGVHRAAKGISETKAWQVTLDTAAAIKRYETDPQLRDLADSIMGFAKTMLAQVKSGVHVNPAMLTVLGANPSPRGAKRLGYVREIRYVRGPGLRHAGQKFKHVFKTREACVYGLTDGSILIRG